MANRTFITLKTAIQTEMQLDPGLISDVERGQFINDCLADLGELGNFEKSASLSLTTGVASLPSDFVGFIAILRDGVAIPPTSLHNPNTSNGYVLSYKTITVYPLQTETLTLIYNYAPAALVGDTDIPDIPLGFDQALVFYSVARANMKNGNMGIYREYMSFYQEKKAALSARLTKQENSRVLEITNAEPDMSDELMY